MFLPSSGAIANVEHRELDLHFQGHIILHFNISKTVRDSENYLTMTFPEVDIRHRSTLLRMLCTPLL